MRYRRAIVLTVISMFVMQLALAASAHTAEEITEWETEWQAVYDEALTSPLEEMLVYELERDYFWFMQRHRCHYMDICPVVSSLVAPKGQTSQTTPVLSEWEPLVASYFPASQVATAMCVIWYESGGDPGAYNPSGASGLFQVMPMWFDLYGGNAFDPVNNVRVAALVYAEQGWSAWSVWKKGLC